MIIGGIDPGYERVGYAFLEISKKNISAISYGLISTKKEASFAERLYEIGSDIEKLLQQFSPSVLFLEKIFFGTNKNTVLPVSEARGIIRYFAQKYNSSVQEIAPSSVKKRITGYGYADKAQMIQAVTLLLSLPEPPSPDDVADALAIALCGSIDLN